MDEKERQAIEEEETALCPAEEDANAREDEEELEDVPEETAPEEEAWLSASARPKDRKPRRRPAAGAMGCPCRPRARQAHRRAALLPRPARLRRA